MLCWFINDNESNAHPEFILRCEMILVSVAIYLVPLFYFSQELHQENALLMFKSKGDAMDFRYSKGVNTSPMGIRCINRILHWWI